MVASHLKFLQLSVQHLSSFHPVSNMLVEFLFTQPKSWKMKWLGSVCHRNDDRKNFYFPYIYIFLASDSTSTLTLTWPKNKKKEQQPNILFHPKNTTSFPFSRIQNFIQPLALKWNICLGVLNSRGAPQIEPFKSIYTTCWWLWSVSVVPFSSRFLEGTWIG